MKRKKIFVDGLGLVEGHFSGIGQYILGVLRGLDEIVEKEMIAGNDPPEVIVFIPYNSLHTFKKFNFKYIRARRLPFSFRIMSALWHRDLMPPIDLFLGRGFFIFPRFVSMRLLFSKSCIVIYDLSFELFKQFSDEKNAIFLKKGINKSLTKTNNIVTISQNAKKEIVDHYKVKSSDVYVATPAVDTKYFYRRSEREINKVKEKYEIEGDYILALSNLEPRKNLGTLVDAYCFLPKELKDQTGLLLVGVSGWKIESLFEKIIKKVEDGEKIMRPSKYVSDKDKPAIISGAKLLVYPSHYEGFGIPPLEALSCGVPVITSDNSSLPEVVGSVGTMVPSTDITRLSHEIKRIMNDIDTITDKARRDGPAQANNFNWRQSAQVYWDLAHKELS